MRPVVLNVLILAATAAPTLALGQLISPGVWAGAVAAGVGTAALVLMILRASTGWTIWPSVIALALGFAGVLAVEPGTPSRSGSSIGESLAGLVPLAVEGARTLQADEPPVMAGAGIALLVGLAVTALFVAAEALIVAAESPALGGAPLLLLWLPVIVLGARTSLGLILIAGLAFLAILAAAAIPPGAVVPVLPVIAGVTAVTAAATLILTPWALSYPSWIGAIGGVGGSSTTRLDLGLDVREDLVRGSNTVLMRYRGVGPTELGPIHSHTLSDFDGHQWHTDDSEEWLETSVLYPESNRTMVDEGADPVTVEFHIDNLGQDRVFLPASPRETYFRFLYNPIKDEVFFPSGMEVSYVLQGPPLITDPNAWHEKSREPGAPWNEQQYLDLPQTSKQAEIEELTAAIIGDAESPYEKAVAIQNFFRSDSRFTYTTTVPSPVSDDAVWDFLDDGRGYCVQFATAMVVIARTAGIPARMAVGFLPGTSEEIDGVPGGVVRAHDAHTWPQLHLGAAGWTRFEPTPGSHTGPVPEIARGLPVDSATPEVEEIPTGRPIDVDDPTPEPTQTASPGTGSSDDGAAGLSRWLVSLAAVLLLVGVLWWSERRGQERARLGWGAEEYWASAVALLRTRGLMLRRGDTPNAILRRARSLDLVPQGVDGPGERTWAAQLVGFAGLTEAVNRERYSPANHSHVRAPEEDYEEWLEMTEAAVTEWV